MLLEVLDSSGVSSKVEQTWLYSGGYATVTSYREATIPQNLDWMRLLPTYLDLGDVWLVRRC